MASQFSDPEWWPKPPPKPPRPISIWKVVFGTLVPAVAVIAGAAFVVTQRSGSSAGSPCPAATSAAAPTAGGPVAPRGPQACAPARPPGTGTGRFGGDGPGQVAFESCIRSATAGLSPGSFRHGHGDAIRNAYEVCQTLIQGSGTAPLEPGTTTATPPAA